MSLIQSLDSSNLKSTPQPPSANLQKATKLGDAKTNAPDAQQSNLTADSSKLNSTKKAAAKQSDPLTATSKLGKQ